MSEDLQESRRPRRALAVLVVEDDEDCRDEVCDVLRNAGYAALEATDGTEALEMLVSGRTPEPALILLDIGLPIMSGHELMHVLRSYHRLSRIPVILMSANRTHPGVDARDAGWLPKPFTAEDLLAEVTRRRRSSEPHTPGGW